MAVARHLGLHKTDFELQMLYGMADAEKQALVDDGYRLRIYMPYGELIPGMAYLVRRLLENTSNESFLRASFTEHVSVEKLLMNPTEHRPSERTPTQHRGDGFATPHACRPRRHIPQRAGRRFQPRGKPPRDGLGAGGHRARVRSLPSACDWRPGSDDRRVVRLDQPVAQGAASAGWPAPASPRPTPRCVRPPAHSGVVAIDGSQACRVSARQRRGSCAARRFELAAWQVHECGKPWREADADVCEAIDFCEFYAAARSRSKRPHGVDVPGEENRFEYLPRGVTAIIAPWNFPLAILTGMTTAALVTGNTVVMKPAEQSSVWPRS